jgi:hypothetical protein
MASRRLLMRRLGTLARQLSASESGRSSPGVASLVQQVCRARKCSIFSCATEHGGTSNALLLCSCSVDCDRVLQVMPAAHVPFEVIMTPRCLLLRSPSSMSSGSSALAWPLLQQPQSRRRRSQHTARRA